MKTTNTIIKILSVLFVTVLFVSCSPEDGKDGKDGLDGINGVDGVDGQDGAQGPIGNANVIISSWKNATTFKDTIIDASNLRIATVTAPEITNANLGNSAVMVYINFGGGNFILPHTGNAGGKVSTISFFPQRGKIRPTRFTHDNSNSVNLSSAISYRYVIIPRATGQRPVNNENTQELFALNEEIYTLEELQAMSYEELCYRLNISE